MGQWGSRRAARQTSAPYNACRYRRDRAEDRRRDGGRRLAPPRSLPTFAPSFPSIYNGSEFCLPLSNTIFTQCHHLNHVCVGRQVGCKVGQSWLSITIHHQKGRWGGRRVVCGAPGAGWAMRSGVCGAARQVRGSGGGTGGAALAPRHQHTGVGVSLCGGRGTLAIVC